MDLVRTRKVAVCALLSASLIVPACDSSGKDGSEATAPELTSASTLPETTTADDTSTTGSTAAVGSTTTVHPVDPSFESVAGIHLIGDFAGLTSQGLDLWQQYLPDVQDVVITSTADGSDQPALWLAPKGEQAQPLLVILHSSSAEYLQHAGIPYAMFADENGWAVIAPQFRGVNDDPESTGSDLAVQDVVDAINYAVAQGGVDAERVYAVGYSGGGTMSLLLAGRYPDKVTAVAAWGPPYDLIAFYRESNDAGLGYAANISAACGGDPTSDSDAEQDCLHRSPVTHLDTAREKGVPVFIAQGIHDSILSPSHGVGAFNQLADPDDRLSEEQVEAIGQGNIPEDLSEPVSTETYFGEGDPAPVFARNSGSVWLVLFDADHEMAYLPTLRWFADIQR